MQKIQKNARTPQLFIAHKKTEKCTYTTAIYCTKNTEKCTYTTVIYCAKIQKNTRTPQLFIVHKKTEKCTYSTVIYSKNVIPKMYVHHSYLFQYSNTNKCTYSTFICVIKCVTLLYISIINGSQLYVLLLIPHNKSKTIDYIKLSWQQTQ